MKPDVEMYFTDPAEMVKKATKNVLQVHCPSVRACVCVCVCARDCIL